MTKLIKLKTDMNKKVEERERERERGQYSQGTITVCQSQSQKSDNFKDKSGKEEIMNLKNEILSNFRLTSLEKFKD